MPEAQEQHLGLTHHPGHSPQPSLPECRPALTQMGTSGACLIRKFPAQLSMSRAMLAISAACRFPLRRGSPDATM